MATNMSFMERWGHSEGTGANGRRTRSAAAASSSSTPNNKRSTSQSSSPSKRKRNDANSSTTPSKSRKPNSPNTSTSNTSPEQILRHLLSTASPALTSLSSPFEELLGTVVVSRPIPHAISHRAIQTLISPPYNFTNPRAILDAGETRVFKALEDARTLHKDKTARHIVELASVCLKKFEFKEDGTNPKTGLEKLRQDARGNTARLQNMLQKEVKGVGETASNIFLRRIQRDWEEFYPFVDAKTADSLDALGMPGDAKGLRELLDGSWSDLDLSGIIGNEGVEDENKRKRIIFVDLLRRAVAAQLEKKIDKVREQAGKKSAG